MGKQFPKPHDEQKRQNALLALQDSVKDGKPNFHKTSKETGISVSTLQRWWTKYQLDRQIELKTKLEGAITNIIGRIERLCEETKNLKELAPVVKMLSELLQQFGEKNEIGEEWG